ncbi:MAG: S1C family serine protease [Bacillota bacterium]
MSLFYDGDPDLRRRSWSPFGRTIAVAVIAAVLGGLAGGALMLPFAGTFGPAPRLGVTTGSTIKPVSTVVGTDSPVVQIAQQVGPAVVGITNKAQMTDWFHRPVMANQGAGSGVIFDSRGYIVTNDHVVAGADEIWVSLTENQPPVKAKLIGADPWSDLAVIKIDAQNLPTANFGDSDQLQVGELAVAIGNAVGEFQRTVTAGIISGLNRKVQVQDDTYGEKQLTVIQTDAAINPGNSGGPLVNGQGQVIGINAVKIGATGVEGLGFAIPSNTVRQIVNELVDKGSVSWPWLGVHPVDKDQAAIQLRQSFDHGVLVYKAVAGGPAAKAGLQDGDIILSIGGKAMESSSDVRTIVHTYKVGQRVQVTVLRNGGQKTFTVTLEETPK